MAAFKHAFARITETSWMALKRHSQLTIRLLIGEMNTIFQLVRHTNSPTTVILPLQVSLVLW